MDRPRSSGSVHCRSLPAIQNTWGSARTLPPGNPPWHTAKTWIYYFWVWNPIDMPLFHPRYKWSYRSGFCPMKMFEPLADASHRFYRDALSGECEAILYTLDRDIWLRPFFSSSIPSVTWVRRCRMREAIASTRLQGHVLDENSAILQLRTGRSPSGAAEEQLRRTHAQLADLESWSNSPITAASVCRLNAGLTGEPETQVSPAERSQGEGLAAACSFLNGNDQTFIHPVVRGILFHFWIIWNLPFESHNGQTAQLVFRIHLAQRGYPILDFIPFIWFLGRSESYAGWIQPSSGSTDHNLTGFLRVQLECIREAAHWALAELRQRSEEIDRVCQTLPGTAGLNPRQALLLAHASRHPRASYTIEAHRNSHAVVFQTARDDLFDLEARGLFRRHKAGRTNVFQPVWTTESPPAGNGVHEGVEAGAAVDFPVHLL